MTAPTSTPDDDELNDLMEDIRTTLGKAPDGLSRQKIYVDSSAESLLVLAKALHLLVENGEVINLTGASLGPYVLTANLSQAMKDGQSTSALAPVRQEEEVKVAPRTHHVGPLHQPRAQAVSTAPAVTTPVQGVGGSFSNFGSLSPRLPLGLLAYAIYLIGKAKPGLYVTYDYVIDRIPDTVKDKNTFAKGRANLFRMLAAAGYCERHYDPAKPKSPTVRWNFKRFGYPFANKDIMPWWPQGNHAQAAEAQAEARLEPKTKARAEVAPQPDEGLRDDEANDEILDPVFADDEDEEGDEDTALGESDTNYEKVPPVLSEDSARLCVSELASLLRCSFLKLAEDLEAFIQDKEQPSNHR